MDMTPHPAAHSSRTNTAGEHSSQTVQYTVVPATTTPPPTSTTPPPTTSTPPPVARLSSIRQTHQRWSEHPHRGRHAPPVGTTFSFTLNTPATVTLTFTQHTIGRKRGDQCVAATARNRHATRCTIITTLGSVHVNAHTGTTKVAFAGRIGRRTLRPGSYSVSLSLTRQRPAKVLSFTVVR